MRTSFHHQPEAQHPYFPLSTSWQADYPPKATNNGHLGMSALCPQMRFSCKDTMNLRVTSVTRLRLRRSPVVDRFVL